MDTIFFRENWTLVFMATFGKDREGSMDVKIMQLNFLVGGIES